MKFVVAVDGSAASDAALEHAVEIATAADASITVVHAVDPQVYEQGGTGPIANQSDAEQRLLIEDLEDAEERAETILADAAERAEGAGFGVETELLYGTPVESISEFAATGNFDGIFVGHRGLSERYEEYVGSVAKAFVERSDVPVTVVR